MKSKVIVSFFLIFSATMLYLSLKTHAIEVIAAGFSGLLLLLGIIIHPMLLDIQNKQG
ncbi:MAG: hypothetical protein OIN86_11265 [Candidatus Methanoperedens sp.]|nr:hypothetical protein [Candidatus Methanoperedens sp.]